MFFLFVFPSVAMAEDLFGTDELIENLPSESKDMLEKIGVYSPEDSVDADYGNVIEILSDILSSTYLNPLKIMLLIISIVIVTSFLSSLNEEENSLTSLAGTLTICIIVIPYLVDLIASVSAVTTSLSVFVLASIPVYAVLQIASGNPTLSGTFTTISIFSANIFTALCNTVIIPMLSVFLGLSISSCFSHLNIKSLCQSVYNFLKWVLVTAITLFSSIISMQTSLSVATDKVTTKTIKIVAGSTVPIVGTAFGDGIVAVQNSISLLKSGSGAFGILACVCIFLPPIIELILWITSFNMSVIVADFFADKKAKDLIEVFIIVLKILLAILISFCVISLVISAITIFV